jgi:hypothetical protein
MTKYAENEMTENAKRVLETERRVSDKSRADYASRSKGRPTPTQEENDMAMLGAHIIEHDPDGSDPDPNDPLHNKSMEAAPHSRAQNYQTKEQTAGKTKHE